MIAQRLMRIDFSRHSLQKLGGFTKEIFIQLLQQLPAETEIRGFAEPVYRDCYSILLYHEGFPEVGEAHEYPEIQAIFTKTPGVISIELKWPDSYKQNHTCQYKTYQGFSKVEEICTICGKTK